MTLVSFHVTFKHVHPELICVHISTWLGEHSSMIEDVGKLMLNVSVTMFLRLED